MDPAPTRYTMTLTDTGEHFECAPTENLLEGMVRLGKRGIPVGCRGGGCGVCKIEILSGTFTAKLMSRDHVSVEDQAAGRVLACRTFPTSDLALRVIGLMQKNVYRSSCT